MADYGINRRVMRDKLPLNVLIGFYPTEPVKLSSLAAPLEAATNTVAIKSGMALVKDTGTYQGNSVAGFRTAKAADALTQVSVYIALTDADAHDVQASHKLVGLDCSDKFVVETGYFDTNITWALDDPVTVGAAGVFTKATVGTTVVGYISAIGTTATKTIVKPGLTPSATSVEVIQFKTAQTGLVIPTPPKA